MTLSENERLSNKRSNFETDSDKESIGGGIGLQKSKIWPKKKRLKTTKVGKSTSKVKRKATILVSKKIVREAAIRGLTLEEYIRD